jgi:sulfate transport system ATP-binding protein
MNRGKVEQAGEPSDIYANPATPFVYSFLGAVNEFSGHLEGRNLRVGADLLPIAAGDVAEGKPVVAFARPHELEILPEPPGGAPGIAAKVNRIMSLGSIARVELSPRHSGLNGTGPQFFEVELTPQRLSELDLADGQPVRLVSSQLRVFERGARS